MHTLRKDKFVYKNAKRGININIREKKKGPRKSKDSAQVR